MLNLEKNSWKGIAWQLFIIWPFVLYWIMVDEELMNNGWVIILLIIGSILWLIGLFRLIKLLKNPFGDEKKD